MDFEELFKELKKNLFTLVNQQYSDFNGEAKKAIKAFLEASKDKLERWTKLLANGDLTKDEFEWLLKSQKDLFLVETLYAAGISKIRVGKFKNKVIETLVDVVSKFLL